jgi:hypothetical protein
MRGFFMRPRRKPGKQQSITWQQMRQQLERQQEQRKRQQQERLEQQLELVQQEQRLLLFCRKQPEPEPAEKRSATIFS